VVVGGGPASQLDGGIALTDGENRRHLVKYSLLALTGQAEYILGLDVPIVWVVSPVDQVGESTGVSQFDYLPRLYVGDHSQLPGYYS
jgi:hypothetical protein